MLLWMFEFLPWLFGPGPTLFIFAIGVGGGLTLALAPQIRNIRLAHWFFSFAWIWAMGGVVEVFVTMGLSSRTSYLLVFVTTGLLGVFWLMSFKWVESNHQEARLSTSKDGGAATRAELGIANVTNGDQGGRYAVEIRSAFLSDAGPLTPFVSRAENVIYPIFYLVFVQVSNLSETLASVTTIDFARADTPSGPWKDLAPIPLSSSTIYYIGVNGGQAKSMKMVGGTLWVAGNRDRKELSSAARVIFQPELSNMLDQPLRAGTPMRGWVGLDDPQWHTSDSTKKFPYLRVSIRDDAGHVEVHGLQFPRGRPGGSVEGDVGVLTEDGRFDDLSNLKIRYFSEPLRDLP